ncbi:DUF998 domain-containing protein [Nocardia sp. NPDC004260]
MMIEQKMSALTGRTGALLVCGILAGPIYITLTAIQALTRDGFDPSQHRYNLLTTGDLGWIHRTNYVTAGVLMLLFAMAVGRMLRQGRGVLWASPLLGLYGLAYIASGLFPADPAVGFPPGTMSHSTTWHGIAQMASRSISSAALVAASLVIAGWFAAQGRRNWVLFSLVAVPVSLGAYGLLAAVGVSTSVKYTLFLVPGISMWVWVTALAVHLYRIARPNERPGTAVHRTPASSMSCCSE